MFERILYLVGERQEDRRFVIDLARKHDSAVLLGSVLGADCKPQVKTDGTTRSKVLREDLERQCWQGLYALEEELKASGIRASVIAQQGNPDSIQMLASSTHSDLIVLAASILADEDYRLPAELIPNLPCPLIITNFQ